MSSVWSLAIILLQWCAMVRVPGLALQGFDESSGKPRNPVEMRNWPYHKLLLDEGFTQRHGRRSGDSLHTLSCQEYLHLTICEPHGVEDACVRTEAALTPFCPQQYGYMYTA